MSRTRIGESKSETKPVGTRLPVEVEQLAQRIAEQLSQQAGGVPVSLSWVLNSAIGKGLEVMQRELGTGAKAKPSKPAKSTAA